MTMIDAFKEEMGQPDIEVHSEAFRGVLITEKDEQNFAACIDFSPFDAIRFAQLLLREARKAERKNATGVTVWLHKDDDDSDWLQINHAWEVKKKSAKAGRSC